MQQILALDEKARTVTFTALGREPGRDPYFTHLYRVGLDGKGLTLLTPEDANHDVSLSPSGGHFVDSLRKFPKGNRDVWLNLSNGVHADSLVFA